MSANAPSRVRTARPARDDPRRGEIAWRSPRFHARDRSVDVYVRKLRLKLGAAAPAWRYIHTHHGLGYRFEPQPIEA